MSDATPQPREVLDWSTYGRAVRALASQVADVRCAVRYQKPHSQVDREYVWKNTKRWINFPWSTEPPVLDPAGNAVRDA